MPLLGGRRVAPYAAIVPAAAGALLVACYVPVLLWAPLLGAVTWAYWRRRCRD
ncbi:hypothetical protein [Amycolatopsis plumensis]|uniref:Uncharacterized protein n=1 Tax=Amycolatopsis plumensis TaxID=236508 RepID=A0ABV5U294_9PSEU